MRVLKKVMHTLCSGELDKTCENFVGQKQLPEFKRNCPLCGSKTKEILCVNYLGLVGLVALLLCAVGVAYWQIHRVTSKTVVSLARVVRMSGSGDKLT